jgi:hypothetical protein
MAIFSTRNTSLHKKTLEGHKIQRGLENNNYTVIKAPFLCFLNLTDFRIYAVLPIQLGR